MSTVLMTDYAWPGTAIEEDILMRAGHELVRGPAVAATAEEVEQLVSLHQPDAILTCWAQVSAGAIAASARLKGVARIGVGLDNIAVEECTRRGLWVTNVPDYCMEEVSDHAVGLLLDWTRGITAFDREVKRGAWDASSARLRRLSELTIGIIGFGRIGRRTAAKLKPWGCRLVVSNPAPVISDDVEQLELNALLAAADAVIVHVPLLPETHHVLNDASFARMKPGAFVINVSRGGVIDNAALENLASGHLGGAGLDVVEEEPTPPHSLVGQVDVVATPHVAFSSDASLIELRSIAARCVVSILAGEKPPRNACNQPATRAGVAIQI